MKLNPQTPSKKKRTCAVPVRADASTVAAAAAGLGLAPRSCRRSLEKRSGEERKGGGFDAKTLLTSTTAAAGAPLAGALLFGAPERAAPVVVVRKVRALRGLLFMQGREACELGALVWGKRCFVDFFGERELKERRNTKEKNKREAKAKEEKTNFYYFFPLKKKQSEKENARAPA